MNATLGGANLHPGVNLLPDANLHPGANCAHEHGFSLESDHLYHIYYVFIRNCVFFGGCISQFSS